jgi:hypothetical protein
MMAAKLAGWLSLGYTMLKVGLAALDKMLHYIIELLAKLLLCLRQRGAQVIDFLVSAGLRANDRMKQQERFTQEIGRPNAQIAQEKAKMQASPRQPPSPNQTKE